MISACIVVHNEEKLLPRCLESIKTLVKEIIFVHDGECVDRSLDIARKYQARVYVQPFSGSAEYHRPFTYSQAKEEWILQIDADEFLAKEAITQIRQLVRDETIDGYSFWWPYYNGSKYIQRGPFAKTYKPCLFRKSKLFMIGITQEYPRTYGRLVNLRKIQLFHQPEYNNHTEKMFQTKWVKWAKLQARQIYRINQAPVFNIADKQCNQVYQSYLRKKSRPILSVLVNTLRMFGMFLVKGLLWAGRESWQISWFEFRYLWLTQIYLNKLKHGQRI